MVPTKSAPVYDLMPSHEEVRLSDNVSPPRGSRGHITVTRRRIEQSVTCTRENKQNGRHANSCGAFFASFEQLYGIFNNLCYYILIKNNNILKDL